MREYGPTIQQVARETGLAEHTVRQYAKRGVFYWLRDPTGHKQIRCEPDAARKCREHYLKHGAPGGRPVPVSVRTALTEAGDG